MTKSTSIENVSAKTVQDVFDVIGEKLFFLLVNQSLEEGIFPKSWKESLIVPIPKVSGTITAEEFRSVNMLHILEKNLEILVQEQLIHYLDTHEL